MRFRKGKLADLKELLLLLNKTPQLQTSKEGQTYTKEYVWGTLNDKKRNLVLIAEDKKKIIGFLTAEIWKDKKYSYFCDLFVKEGYRKKGIASKLIEQYETYCKKLGIKNFLGQVLTTNKNMQKFIEKRKYKRGNTFYWYERRIR